MGPIQNRVHYCCVARDSQILYAYNNGGDQRHEGLAALCLEKTPPFHKWYFETMSKRTFGFLIEDGFVYFVIVDEVLKRSGVLGFLERLRDESKKATFYFSNVQDQLVRRLVASLEGSAQSNDIAALPLSSPSEQSQAGNSTKAPLLGRSNKQEKKRGRDHVNASTGFELESQRKSTDRVNVAQSSNAPSSGSRSIERKWRRQVQMVLAIDAAICLTLFGVWLAICNGIQCIRS